MIDPASISQPWFRQVAYDFVMDAVNGEHGRPESDLKYVAMTEGRDQGIRHTSYSSCGDLVHGLWYHVGVRSSWCNRAANGTYRVGANISKIANESPNLCRRTLQPGSIILPGDAMVIWNDPKTTDAHTFVCLELGDDGILLSGDYGQPGGALKRRRLEWKTIGGTSVPFVVGLKSGVQKRVHVWAPLDCVIDVAKSEGKFSYEQRSET